MGELVGRMTISAAGRGKFVRMEVEVLDEKPVPEHKQPEIEGTVHHQRYSQDNAREALGL